MKYPKLDWEKVVDAARGLSQSEIVRAAEDAVKTAILDERSSLKTNDLVTRLRERKEMREAFNYADR